MRRKNEHHPYANICQCDKKNSFPTDIRISGKFTDIIIKPKFTQNGKLIKEDKKQNIYPTKLKIRIKSSNGIIRWEYNKM